MAKNKPNKPTMNQVKIAINNLIYKLNELFKYAESIDSALAEYISFKNDKHKFIEHLKVISKREKETQDDNSNTKDGGHAGSH